MEWIESHFALPTRTEPQTLNDEIEQIAGNPVIDGVLESVGGLVAVLDANRQIVALNQDFLDSLGVGDADAPLGLRPGEAIKCVHSEDMPAGCGTSKHCASCGLAIALVTSLKSDEPVERTCCAQINGSAGPEDLFLSVRAKRIAVGDHQFVLLFLLDITSDQRRAALERTFNHDLNNVLTALSGSAELLSLEIDDNPKELAEMILVQTERLQREVELQRLVHSQQSVDLVPRRSALSWAQILRDLRESLAGSDLLRNRTLTLSERYSDDTSGETIETDRTVLARVLTNMARNALEATPEGGEVRVWLEIHPTGDQDIHVWNIGRIPPEVALRIFQRNFSTKSEPGRGLGTFSMKLLAEQFLNGRVEFTTSWEEGTTFTLRLGTRTK